MWLAAALGREVLRAGVRVAAAALAAVLAAEVAAAAEALVAALQHACVPVTLCRCACMFAQSDLVMYFSTVRLSLLPPI